MHKRYTGTQLDSCVLHDHSIDVGLARLVSQMASGSLIQNQGDSKRVLGPGPLSGRASRWASC
eukprot:364777-Chlamydomonas_euryale.AAC.2